jgi:hypothetical protein
MVDYSLRHDLRHKHFNKAVIGRVSVASLETSPGFHGLIHDLFVAIDNEEDMELLAAVLIDSAFELKFH